MKIKRLILVALLSLVLIAGVLGIPQALSSVFAEGEPPAGTVAGVKTYTFYPTTALTGSTQTVYSSSPYNVSGRDVTLVKYWNSADVFVTVDLGTASSLTATPQHSPDQANWADAYHSYVANSQATTVITNQTTITVTDSLQTNNYQVVLSADGTGYTRIPVVGEYLRFKMEYSGTLTPTIKVTLRNNGGTVEGLLAQP